MYSTTLLIFVTVCLLTAQASHFPDLFGALDSLLCQNAERKQSTIIDIKRSISLGAELLDGKWMDDIDTCISECCGTDRCDFALFKNEGASSSGKNCYFVSCGDSESNCVMVANSGFTSAVVVGSKGEKEGQKNTSPLTTPLPPRPISTDVVTTPTPSQPTTTTTSEVSHSNTTPTPVSHSESTGTAAKPIEQNTDSNSSKSASEDSKSNKSKSDSNSKDSETVDENKAAVNNAVNPGPTNNGGSGMIAVVIVGVVCFAIVVIVAGVLAQKIWSDRRRRRFRNVDYLINGMYT